MSPIIVETTPNATKMTKMIQSTNMPVPLCRAELYESTIGTIIASAKHKLCIQPQAWFTQDQLKKLKNPDTAIAMPTAITIQNENLLSVKRGPVEVVVLRVRFVLFCLAILFLYTLVFMLI